MDSVLGLKTGEGNKLPKPNNAFPVITSPDKDFFVWWCTFLRAFTPLSDKEIKVVACFLRRRWEMSKSISDQKILDTVLMSDTTKKEVAKECNMTIKHLYVVLSSLRKHGIIENNAIRAKLIPNIRPTDNGYFQLLILFKDYNHDEV